MSRKNLPLVSVVMPVFNAAPYLASAIQSIIYQSYPRLEIIIVDDVSTDNSLKIIKHFAKLDQRIKVYKNNTNSGVSATTNFAIQKCHGQFLARMDADDISSPDRFQKQLNFLTAHPNHVAVGGQCLLIDYQNNILGQKLFPTSHTQIQKMIFWAIPLQQPSLMINLKKLPKNFSWYQPHSSSAEEVDLIFRLMLYGQLANLKDYLLYYRLLNNSLSHRRPKTTFLITLKSRFLAIKFGHRPSLLAILINLFQLLAVFLLPAPVINELWSLIRFRQNSSFKISRLPTKFILKPLDF